MKVSTCRCMLSIVTTLTKLTFFVSGQFTFSITSQEITSTNTLTGHSTSDTLRTISHDVTTVSIASTTLSNETVIVTTNITDTVIVSTTTATATNDHTTTADATTANTTIANATTANATTANVTTANATIASATTANATTANATTADATTANTTTANATTAHAITADATTANATTVNATTATTTNATTTAASLSANERTSQSLISSTTRTAGAASTTGSVTSDILPSLPNASTTLTTDSSFTSTIINISNTTATSNTSLIKTSTNQNSNITLPAINSTIIAKLPTIGSTLSKTPVPFPFSLPKSEKGIRYLLYAIQLRIAEFRFECFACDDPNLLDSQTETYEKFHKFLCSTIGHAVNKVTRCGEFTISCGSFLVSGIVEVAQDVSEETTKQAPASTIEFMQQACKLAGHPLIVLAEALVAEDIDECNNPYLNDCSPNSHCTNTDGYYNCTCNQEYSQDISEFAELPGRACAVPCNDSICPSENEVCVETAESTPLCQPSAAFYRSEETVLLKNWTALFLLVVMGGILMVGAMTVLLSMYFRPKSKIAFYP